jgi:hypothetical protein
MSRSPHRRFVRFALCAALLAGPSGCATGSGDAPPDLGRDARIPASPDLGTLDAGRDDLGVDAGPADLGAPDAAAEDAGSLDAGAGDAGLSDLGTSDAGRSDLGVPDAGAPDLGAPPGYRHTIVIDGVDDFAAVDRLATTTGSYSARLSWDADALFVGMTGADVGSGSATRWWLVFVDTNGVSAGSNTGVPYNTQTPRLPPGFFADYAFRWKANNLFQSLQRWNGSAWEDTATVPATFQTGNFVETRIALADLGSPASLGVTMLMLNEAAGVEFSYAGTPAGTFSDGYYGSIPMSRWIAADLALAATPNDLSRLRP